MSLALASGGAADSILELPESDPLPPRVRRILALAREHLGMDVATITGHRGEREVCRWVEGAGSSFGLRPGVPVPEGWTRPSGAGERTSRVCVPIKHADGRALGRLCCATRSSGVSVTGRDLRLLEGLADLAALELDQRSRPPIALQSRARRIREVIEDGLIEVLFQPILRLESMELAGYEALARIDARPLRGPAWWFAEAGRVGLRTQLELAAARAALASLSELPTEGYLSINLSPLTVMSHGFAAELPRFPEERVAFELTEHVEVEQYGVLAATLMPFRARGVRLAIDDVGAGYSSFRHILQLIPDIIKLDISLTRRIDEDPARRALAAALVSFARGVGTDLVAEGISNASELRAARELGIPYGQGYFLAQPTRLDSLRPSGAAGQAG